MSKIWFSSDFHLGHKNYCKGVSAWEDKSQCRNFSTIPKMDQVILDGINKHIQPEDALYFLGDFSFGGYQNAPLYRDRINCDTIYFIKGNHDEKIARNPFLFQTIQDTIILDKYQIYMNHYPHLSWIGSAKGYIMLHGHEHGAINHLNENCRRLDVGIDSAYKIFGEYRPFSLEEVLEINNKKPISELGHHTKNTNIR